MYQKGSIKDLNLKPFWDSLTVLLKSTKKLMMEIETVKKKTIKPLKEDLKCVRRLNIKMK